MTVDRTAFDYQPYYCEENVWRLAGDSQFADGRVVFVSNEQRRVPLWCQRAAPDPSEPILWDYHVFLIAGLDVFDLDTTLPFPCDAATYVRKTFRMNVPPWAPRFRVTDGAAYRAALSTDRSHMHDDAGNWTAPPPAWPTIGTGTNLMQFVALDDDRVPGQAIDLDGLMELL